MNRHLWLPIALTCALASQTPAAAETLGSSMGIFVYPTQNQTPEQQSADDTACFNWAKEQSGYDPINPTQVAAAPVDQGPRGARLRGAARGAAAGAVVGEIANDDAGEGAAIGATLGVVSGGRRARQEKSNAEQQAQQAAAQQTTALQDSFKKAYAACIQARGYTATY